MTSALNKRRVLLAGALLMEFCLAIAEIYGRRNNDMLFYICICVQALIALAIARFLSQGEQDRLSLLLMLAAAGVLRLWFVFEPPLLSGDIYRYIWDGKVINAGFNPYVHIPADPLLTTLRDPAQFGLIDKRDYAVTIYPPVAEGIFALVTRMSSSVAAMKLVMLIFEGVAVAAVFQMMKALGRSPGWMALYLLHPAGIWEIAGNGHAEAAMMAFVFGALAWGGKAGERRGAALLITLGALIKPTGALALPPVWRSMDLLTPALCAALIAVCYAPFLSAGSGVIGFLPMYLHEQGLDDGQGYFALALARRIGAFEPWMTSVYVTIAAAVMLALSGKVGFDRDASLKTMLRGTALLMLVFLTTLSPTLPWYFLPVAMFAPLLGLWSPVAMTTTGFLLYAFNPDPISFFIRWSLGMALIAPALVRDFLFLRQGRTMS